MDIREKSVGIWGFGIVGKAAANYFNRQGAIVDILDKRELSDTEKELVKTLHASFCQQTEHTDIAQWLKDHAYVLASPGIDLRPYQHHQDKFVTELDLLYHSFGKPIIAVTGSVGKTTVTTLLATLLKSHYPNLWTGGNIGTGMLEALETPADAALLELSSFQLEHCKLFAPDIALWTNLYPNHLDRHGTIEAYCDAKKNILVHQHSGQHAIVPLSLRETIGSVKSTIHYIATENDILPTSAVGTSSIFYIRDTIIMKRDAAGDQPLISITELPDITFTQNWLIICAALHILGIPLHTIHKNLVGSQLPAHRLELVATIHGVDFYNDSKATTPAAALAAVQKLHANGRPVILIVGGLSKGINRESFIKQLKGLATFIYCIGKEREQLAAWCTQGAINHHCVDSLEAVFAHFKQQMKPGDQLLLSPAGSSFDQFKDYQDRGDQFKRLVNTLFMISC